MITEYPSCSKQQMFLQTAFVCAENSSFSSVLLLMSLFSDWTGPTTEGVVTKSSSVFFSTAHIFEQDKWEPHSKFTQQFSWQLWQIQAQSQLRFSQWELADFLIISSHPHMYFRFASDKAAKPGINIWRINLLNKQGEIRGATQWRGFWSTLQLLF